MTAFTVIIPAYNEEEGLGPTLENVLAFVKKELKEWQVIVVDDASTDGTREAAGKHGGVTVIRNPVNIGYGGSIKRALPVAKHEYIVIMDADGSYPAGEIRKLVPYAGDFDMIVGARQGRHYHGPLTKRLSRLVFYVLLKYVTGENIPDANSGLRIFRKHIAERFAGDLCEGFSFTTTLTLIMLSNRYLVKFVPIEYARRAGKSKIKYMRDTARTVQLLFENISYYNPIKAFLPFSVLSFAIFVFFTVSYVFKRQTTFYGLAAVMSFFSSMFFFGLGLACFAVVTKNRKKA